MKCGYCSILFNWLDLIFSFIQTNKMANGASSWPTLRTAAIDDGISKQVPSPPFHLEGEGVGTATRRLPLSKTRS